MATLTADSSARIPTAKTDELTKLFTIAEVAGVLKMSKRTIYRMIREKYLPAKKVGGQWRVIESDFRDWIQKLEVAIR